MTDATIDLNRLRVAQRNTDITSPDGTLPPDAPDWIWEVDNPYLHGPYAPIKTEMTDDTDIINLLDGFAWERSESCLCRKIFY